MLPIVIVDDSREDALLAVRILKQCKVVNPVIVLGGGEECIHFFDGKGEHRNRSLPCLLFLDLAMNPVSGVDVLRELKTRSEANSNLRASVVIMLSGVQDLKLVNDGYQLGASTFLIKPLRCEDVMQIASTVRGLGVERNEDGNVITLDDPINKKKNGLLTI